MNTLLFRTILTLPRSGSHFLAHLSNTHLNALCLTTDKNKDGLVTVSEYQAHVIKRGLVEPDEFLIRNGIKSIYLFSHPHHFFNLAEYKKYVGLDKVTLVVSYPFDAVYSLYKAMSDGYRDTPTDRSNPVGGEITADRLASLNVYDAQKKFIKSIFNEMGSHDVVFYRYEDFDDKLLSSLLGQEINNCGFQPNFKRCYWDDNYDVFAPCALDKILSDYSELIKHCYPEKLNVIK